MLQRVTECLRALRDSTRRGSPELLRAERAPSATWEEAEETLPHRCQCCPIEEAVVGIQLPAAPGPGHQRGERDWQGVRDQLVVASEPGNGVL